MNRRMALRSLGASSTVLIGLSLTGCTGLGASDPESGNVDGLLVEMTDDNRFEPDDVTVPLGETVIWRTVGYAPHTVTAYEDEIPSDAAYFASGGFTSESAARDGASEGTGILNRDEEYAHTFGMPGSYAYYCIPHEQAGMTGAITVEGQDQTSEESG